MNEQPEKKPAFENISDYFNKAKELIASDNFNEALPLLEKVLAITPDFYPALYAKSMVTYSLNDLDGAEELWNKSWEKEWQK